MLASILKPDFAIGLLFCTDLKCELAAVGICQQPVQEGWLGLVFCVTSSTESTNLIDIQCPCLLQPNNCCCCYSGGDYSVTTFHSVCPDLSGISIFHPFCSLGELTPTSRSQQMFFQPCLPACGSCLCHAAMQQHQE